MDPDLLTLVAIDADGGFAQARKLKIVDDPVEAILNGRVADPEEGLHALDRAMASEKRSDEHLIFEVELTERGDFDFALDRQSAIAADHAYDGEWTVTIGAFGLCDTHSFIYT